MISPERTQIVASAAKRWQDALVDDSGRNQLAYYRELKAGTLNLSDAKIAALQQLAAGNQVTLKQLFPDNDQRVDAVRRTRAVRKQMRLWAEERGVDVGYLTTGMATWHELVRPPRSPVLLQRLEIRPTSASEADFYLKADPEPSINPVLLHKLEKDHGVRVPTEELLDLEPEQLFERLAKLAQDVPDFLIEPGHLVGTFTYAKLPMVDDLGNIDVLAAHDVISALAGDRHALSALTSLETVDTDAPDKVAPPDEYLVLDADSSQSYAVNAVVSGQHLVIKGPPGTGKSQTIANIIAALAARGKTALFVAEKRAAIDAVLDRLEQAGLDDLVYNLHGEQQSRRELARSLDSRLHRARTEVPPRLEEADRKLLATRGPLIAHHHALHEPRKPWGISVFNIQSQLLGLPEEAHTPVRWSGAELRSLHTAFADQISAAFVELANLPPAGAWKHSTVSNRETAQEAYELASQAAYAWAQAKLAVNKLTAEVALKPVITPIQARTTLELAMDVQFTLERLKPECFTTDLGVWEGFWNKRRAVKTMKSLWIGRKPQKAMLQKAAAAVTAQKERWAQLSVNGSLPKTSSLLPSVQQHVYTALDALDQLYAHIPLNDLELHLEALASDQAGLLISVRRNELNDFLEPFAVQRLLDGPPELAEQRFQFAWLSSLLDHLRFVDDHLGRFQGLQLHATAAQFRMADKEHVTSNAQRVRHQAALRMIDVLDAYPDQQRLVRSESAKKTRHMPVRKLFEEAPEALMALKPCWAMSPLLASQILPARTLFDVVIFDEASQVEPVDAITAIMRGKQIVVAGDEHQLPPTAFFQRIEGEAEFDEDIDGLLTDDIESLLQSFAHTLPLAQVKHLAWHYRSRDERLIAFSNTHIYSPNGNPLTTFPGADTADCIRHVLVESEVEQVVKLILEHATERPDESLGVITMGIKHAENIDLALRQALAKRSDLADFFAESGVEPFFVKSIERVQGDERDAIILSIGYSRTHDGRMAYRFGPLNNKGGERRLNVAITRAKHRMTVVSSFRHSDLDPHRLRSQGAKLLGGYLEYAASGGKSVSARTHSTLSLNAFETDVRDELAKAGLPVTAQYGVGGHRIDLAVAHPDDPARMVLAIEADGASYHAAPTARDRDRLRQQHLERLGWRFHRIWSTDWFQHREREVERARSAYQEALTTPVPVAVASVAPAEPVIAARGPRPELPEFEAISDLPEHVLAEFVAWIESDGLNRTEAEVVEETIEALGFQRRGTRIVEAVTRARRTIRSGQQLPPASP
ncbi:AAA domain-containing protein [Catelliglobosispora koreensis]|uniref:AAA domain-containing protein n=1 Tax=Catelliglobosispora koreensis TaxID=129052 RepID=UPI00036B9865|nr:AAA domain-containing protein [Catelliglobosispora koreensis]